MEMHQLRYLEAAARSGSMMAAAAACHVSQPALSVQIKKLEEELGAALLVRGARGVTLTPAGQRTLASARRVLREVEQLRLDAKRRSFRVRATVRVAVQPHLATELLPRTLGPMLESPTRGWRIEFRERTPARLIESVANGGADLGLLDLATAARGPLAFEELVRIPYAFFCHPDHVLAGRSAVKLVQLLDHRLLVYESSPGLSQRLHALAARRGAELNVPFSSEQASTIFEFVAAGAGVAVLPATFATRAKRRHVVQRPLADYPEEVVVGAVWREDAPLSPLLAEWLETVRASLAGATRGG